ncbi:hypothetical protein ACNKHS_12440 [Shigella flexneri]
MTAILGHLVNSAVCTLLFGFFGRKIYRPGLHFSWRLFIQPALRRVADRRQHYQLCEY